MIAPSLLRRLKLFVTCTNVVIWDRMDYLLKAEKEFNNTSIYNSIRFKEKLLTGLVESSKNMFFEFKTKRFNKPKRASILYL